MPRRMLALRTTDANDSAYFSYNFAKEHRCLLAVSFYRNLFQFNQMPMNPFLRLDKFSFGLGDRFGRQGRAQLKPALRRRCSARSSSRSGTNPIASTPSSASSRPVCGPKLMRRCKRLAGRIPITWTPTISGLKRSTRFMGGGV